MNALPPRAKARQAAVDGREPQCHAAATVVWEGDHFWWTSDWRSRNHSSA